MPQFDRFDEGDFQTPRDRRFQYPPSVPQEPTTQSLPDVPTEPPPDYGNFEFPSYQGSASPSYNFGDAPTFDAPDFASPSFADAQNEPGYQFRLDAGRQALERGAAARGTLRTGGTLKGILEYGQNYGAQEYANLFNRALQTYGTKYQAAKDEFAPKFAQYQNQFGAEQSRAMAEFQRQMEIYNADSENARYKEALISGVLNTPQPQFGG